MAQIAFTGNVVAQPEIKFAANGKAVTKARLAENHRGKNAQTGEWEDQGTSWRNIVAFGNQAEKLAELQKGNTVIIMGRESSRAYTKDGEERQWTEVAVDAFGIVPKNQQGQQSQPRTANAQGEGWGAQNSQSPANNGQWGAGTGGGGYQQPAPQQGGFDQPPF